MVERDRLDRGVAGAHHEQGQRAVIEIHALEAAADQVEADERLGVEHEHAPRGQHHLVARAAQVVLAIAHHRGVAQQQRAAQGVAVVDQLREVVVQPVVGPQHLGHVLADRVAEHHLERA